MKNGQLLRFNLDNMKADLMLNSFIMAGEVIMAVNRRFLYFLFRMTNKIRPKIKSLDQIPKCILFGVVLVVSLALLIMVTHFISDLEVFGNRNVYPHKAVEFIAESNILGPLYNAYDKETIFEELSTTESALEVDAILEKYEANALIIDRAEAPFLEHALLAKKNWILVYFDDISAVFVRNVKEHQKMIDQYSYNSLYPIGVVPFREGAQAKEAIKEYEQALEINPDSAGGYRDLSLIYQHLGEYDLAVKNMLKAIDLTSKKVRFLVFASKENRISLSDMYANLANIYVKDKKWTEAVKYYRKALRLQPENPRALNNLGLIYASFQMDKKKALATLRKYLGALEKQDKQGFSELVKNVTKIIEEIKKNGPQPKPNPPKEGFVQAGVFKKYLDNPLMSLEFQFDKNKLALISDGHHSWQYGAYVATGSASTNTTRSRYMAMTSPDIDNMRVIRFGHKTDRTGIMRMALYVGGVVGNPDGATKVYDSGQLTHGGGDWEEFAFSTPYDLAKNTQFGIAWKGDGASYYYDNSASGNLEDCDQYWDNLSNEPNDSSTAFKDTLNVDSTYDWTYLHYIVYVLYPTISSVSDTTLEDGQTGVVISGTGFEAHDEFGAGTSKVWLTENNDWDTPGTKVQQTIVTPATDWSNTSITFTVVAGGLSGTAYLWVENSDLQQNATGYTVTFNNPPVATTPATITQYTDGSGYVSFQTTISDADNDDTKLKVEYSDDGATNWYDPDLVSVTPTSGTVDLDDASTYQIGSVDAIDTSGGAVTLTIVWDTQSAANGGGSLDDTDQTDIQIRVTPNDTTDDATTQASANFEVDNLDPAGLTALNVTATTATTASLSWTAVTETNFNHYEIWYGTNQADVQARGGTAVEWGNSDDPNLATRTTTTTTITGLTAGQTYYFKIWAIDDAGNEETVADTSAATNNPPVLHDGTTENVLPALTQATDGSGKVTITFRIRDAESETCSAVSASFYYKVNGGGWNAILDTDITGSKTGLSSAATLGGALHTLVWDNSKDHIDNAESANVQIKFKVNDGTDDSAEGVSPLGFNVDNLAPAVLEAVHLEDTAPVAGQTTIQVDVAWTETNPNINEFDYKLGEDADYHGWAEGDSNAFDPGPKSFTVTAFQGDDYIDKIKARHTDDFGNVSAVSEDLSDVYVKPYTPPAPTVDNPTSNTVDVTVNKQASEVTGLEYAIYVSSHTKYVQANGTLGDSALWQTKTLWSTKTVTGLSAPVSNYTFKTKSRNSSDNLTESELSSGASTANTAPTTPTIDNHNTGTFTNDNTPTLQFDLSDPDSGDIIKYQIQIDTVATFDSQAGTPLVDYTEPTGLATPRDNVTYTPTELADGDYYWRVKCIDDELAESSWAIANSGEIAFVVDTTRPTVIITDPSAGDGETNVPVDIVITATFNEAMDSSSITTDSFTLTGSTVSGTVSYDESTYTATFTPDANLEYDHEYTATLTTDIKDAAGNSLASSYSWSFTTESSPTPTQYTLTLNSTVGGSVSTPGEGTYTYGAGTGVSISAMPASGYSFVEWTGDVGTVADVNAASTRITMNGNYTVTANFTMKAKLEITKVANHVSGPNPPLVGATTTYDLVITVKNVGDNAARSVVVKDALPAGVTYKSSSVSQGSLGITGGSSITWSVGRLAGGAVATATITVSVKPTAADAGEPITLNNGATATGADEPSGTDVSGGPTSSTYTLAVVQVILTIAKDGPALADAGTTITYTISYGNIGTGNATNVVITDVVPEDTTFVSATDGGTYDPASNTVTWHIEPIPAGPTGLAASLDVKIDTDLPPGTTVITNQASIASYYDTELIDEALSNEVSTTVVVPFLEIDKSVNTRTAETGDIIIYTVKLTNTSTHDEALDIGIRDILPFGIVYISGSTAINGVPVSDPSGSNPLSWRIDAIAAESTATITYRCAIGLNAVAGFHDNEATIQGYSVDGTTLTFPNGPPAVARVKVAVFETRGIIIGKVFEDLNGDGWQDEDEPGIPGIDIVMEDGTTVTTDVDGEYSIPGVEPGYHVLTVDEATLPEGYEILGEVSKFVEVPEAGMAKLNFMVVKQEEGEAKRDPDLLHERQKYSLGEEEETMAFRQ